MGKKGQTSMAGLELGKEEDYELSISGVIISEEPQRFNFSGIPEEVTAGMPEEEVKHEQFKFSSKMLRTCYP